jgi:hypothetical protein
MSCIVVIVTRAPPTRAGGACRAPHPPHPTRGAGPHYVGIFGSLHSILQFFNCLRLFS